MSDPAPKAIFLSYARDDAAAARRVAEALRGAGLEVWFDENELTGGDAWDQKIRTQIGECALFLPLISANTQSRLEGYFRLEWRIAEQRSHLMAKGKRFLVPVCIDDTREKGAQVPDAFLEVQWTRVADGAASPQFIELVKRLLSPLSQTAGAAQPAATAPAPTSPPGSRGFPNWAIGVIAALVIGAAYFALRPTPKTTASAPPTIAEKPVAPVTNTAPVAPESEARKLVAKARALYEPWDLASRDDFLLAEELLKKAIDLDPSDGEAWAAAAILSCGAIAMNRDLSPQRKVTARTQAERAIKLAPDSGQARFARAFSLRYELQTQDEAIRLLRAEAARQPTNRFVVRTLGAALRSVGEHEQGLVYLDRAAALPGNDPVTHYNRALALLSLSRLNEAEAALDEALAAAPGYVSANRRKIEFLLNVREDLPRAQLHLTKVPAEFFRDDLGIWLAYRIALFTRDSKKCLQVLQSAPDYLTSGPGFNGPKACLSAQAHLLAGHAEAARTDLLAARHLVEQRLASQPNNWGSLQWRAAILAGLGEKDTAESILREIRQRSGPTIIPIQFLTIPPLLLSLITRDEVLADIEARLRSAGEYNTGLIRISLRYDPGWDPLRDDPRFQALLRTPASKR